jgi:hypothetical protein
MSPVFMPEAALLSAVPGAAVAERLLPILPDGLFCCAIAAPTGAISKVEASKSERDVENILRPSERAAGKFLAVTKLQRDRPVSVLYSAAQHHAISFW